MPDGDSAGKPAFIRKWTREKALEARQFIERSEPGLWSALVQIKKSGLDFIDRPETTRALQLIGEFNTNHQGLDNVELWGGLVRLMREEIDGGFGGDNG